MPEQPREMARFVQAAGVVARRIAGELVLIPTGDESPIPVANFYVLNDSGTRLWEALETPKTVDDLASTLVACYALENQLASADARRFVTELMECGMVRPIPAAPET